MEGNMVALTEDIAQMCGDLTLTESEANAVVMSRGLRQQGVEKLKLCLMGKFLANKQINGDVFINTIPKIWKTKEEFEVEMLDNNIFAFYFQNQADRKRVKAGGPWHFDNFLLVLEEPSMYGETSEMNFNGVEFWVHILKAPLCCMTRETSCFLGEQIGRVTDIDERENNTSDGRIIRIRVEVDIKKPLKRFLKVDLSGSGETCILTLKYERLPDFCYQCGLLGHGDRECLSGGDRECLSGGDSSAKKINQYGHWLRAPSSFKKNGSWKKKGKFFKKPAGETSKGENPKLATVGHPVASEECGKNLKEAERLKAKEKQEDAKGWKGKGKLEVRDEVTKMAKPGESAPSEVQAPLVLKNSHPTKVLWYAKPFIPTQKTTSQEERGNADFSKEKLKGSSCDQTIFPDKTLVETMPEVSSTKLRDSGLLLAEVAEQMGTVHADAQELTSAENSVQVAKEVIGPGKEKGWKRIARKPQALYSGPSVVESEGNKRPIKEEGSGLAIFKKFKGSQDLDHTTAEISAGLDNSKACRTP